MNTAKGFNIGNFIKEEFPELLEDNNTNITETIASVVKNLNIIIGTSDTKLNETFIKNNIKLIIKNNIKISKSKKAS